MSNTYVGAEELNTASILGEVVGESVLGEVEVTGVIIEQHPDIPPATEDSLGGIIVGDHLSIDENGRLSVITADSVEGDNTHPISAAAVYMEVGNINALLHTI